MKEFNASRYSWTTRVTMNQLNALASTEHIIHQNIEKSFKGFSESQFKVGDKLWCKNPDDVAFSDKYRSRYSFQPITVEGMVTEVLPGGMFKVAIGDTEDKQKFLF